MSEHTRIHVQRADHIGFAVASLDEALRFWVTGLAHSLCGRARWKVSSLVR